MPLTAHPSTRRLNPAAQDGFTMIVALGVMLVTSLLLVAAFTATNSDVHLSRLDTIQKQAYFAATTGVQEYEHKLQANSDYWESSCTGPSGTVPGESHETYATEVLPANGKGTCNTATPFETMIESKGIDANTFRIKSTGTVGGETRSIVATFRVSGFLDYAYFTQYEDEDPYLSKQPNCERYYEEGNPPTTRSSRCGNITFTHEDSVNGPMHTDDSALVECSSAVSFGRASHNPPDAVQIVRGTWSSSQTKAQKASGSPCSGSGPTYNTANGKFSEEGGEPHAPPSDTSVKAYVETGFEFVGRTTLILEGETISVKNPNFHGGATTPISWPANGLIYVRSGSSCGFEYSNTSGGSDTSTTYEEELECGSVYVQGNYAKSLTIGAETDVIINGNITPTGVTAGNPPTGTTTLGLMATRFVRIYHPCTSGFGGGNQTGYLEEPWIYAAILSTSHSFLVDNYNCGAQMGHLNIYGAIAQKFRGVVGQVGGGGYLKNYIYDERLATDEPPYFLAPLDAGWEIARETAAKGG
jgi:Tfp pilus assembly protein PilX